LKIFIVVLSSLWGAAIVGFSWILLSADQSISYAALANAAGSSAWEYLLIFLVVMFGAWAIPTSVLWQLNTRFHRSPWVASTIVLFGALFYLLINHWSAHEEEFAELSVAVPAEEESRGDILLASAWQCENDVEISCGEDGCNASVSEDFTPMSVNFDDSGSISVCAYSGCWEGHAQVVGSNEFLVLIGHDLPFSTSPDSDTFRESIVIAFDRADSVATIKAGEFSHPLLCRDISK